MKKIITGVEARKYLKQGIDKCCDVVKVSMGAYGKNVLIYNGQTSEIINDGVSIAKAVEVKDEIEQAGIQLAKQCAEMTNNSAGDGTTTTLVLLQAILNEVITDFQTENPRDLREKLFKEAREVLSNIEIKQIKTKKDIYNLSLTSSLDDKVAEIISEIYWELGKDAKITVEERQEDVLEHEFVKGIQFDSKKGESKLLKSEEKIIEDDIYAIVSEKCDREEIQKAVSVATQAGKDKLIVISNQFDRNVLISFMNTQNFKFIPVEYREFRNIEDIKDYIGDKPLEKIIITDETTTLIGGKGNVEAKIELLKAKKEETTSQFEKEQIDSRIASLLSGVAVIRIGKQTDVEREEYVLKIEDALNCVKGAYEQGYCVGGGSALARASKGTSEMMTKILCSPYKQICENAGKSLEIPDTVIDSFKSVKESLLNALSTATSVMTVEALLVEEKEDDC